ncbi:hypothetical protein D3C71_1572410 [compost metagenome]
MAGHASHGAQSTHALHDLVESRALAVRAVLPEPGDAGKDHAWVQAAQAFIREPQPLLHYGTEVLHHHVRAAHQRGQDFGAFGRLQVQAEAALVAMQVLFIRAPAPPGDRSAVTRWRRFDADDIGPPVRQQPNGNRASAGNGKIQDGVAGQRCVVSHRSSSCIRGCR